ncbi:MAG: hypothetical protein ABSE77_09305 [Acidimicrobiales bacterium]
MGSGGSCGELLAPAGVTAEAAPLPPGGPPTPGLGLDPAVAAALPGGGWTCTAGLGGVTAFFAGRGGGVVVVGTALGTVVEGEVLAGTVVGVTASSVGVGGVGVEGTEATG